MLIVKLFKDRTIKIVEAVEVEVFACGKAPGSDEDPSKRTSKVREVAGKSADGGFFAFYVSNRREQPKDLGFSEEVTFYDCAYIENSHGATTEKVLAG